MKRNFICILILFAVIALSGAFIVYTQSKKADSLTAYIYSNDVLIRTIDLTSTDEPYSFTVTTDNGEYNTVFVRQGEIAVVEASCPDEICVKTRFIHSSALPIVCLPNKLSIEIRSEKSEEDIDAVAQ